MTALSVGSDGAINLGLGATYGITLALLFSHGLVCSSATGILARINVFYVIISGMSIICTLTIIEVLTAMISRGQSELASL